MCSLRHSSSSLLFLRLFVGILFIYSTSSFRLQSLSYCSLKMSSSYETVGFVGLGIMGKGMLKNLIQKLEPTTKYIVWNRNAEVSKEIAANYPDMVTIATTPADLARSSNLIVSMLSTPDASVDVFDEPNSGLIQGISAGKTIVDCATLSPERMIDIEQRVIARGGRFLEAPVSGSKVPAETGQLIFLCGGEPSVYDYSSTALQAMGKAKFLCGPVGQGSRLKLVINMIMGSMLASFSEGLSLGKAYDIPLETILEVLDLGVMANAMFRGKGAAITQGNYSPNFPLKHAQKDMKLALDLAEQRNLQLVTSAAANAVFVQALNENLGDEDFAAVYKAAGKGVENK